MRFVQLVAVLALLPFASARAGVVINEVFYNAPNDLDDLQWIELHNTGDQPVSLDDWTIDKGDAFTFPKDTKIEAQGYLVVALKPDAFKKTYGGAPVGPLKRKLKRGGEKIELANAKKEPVDVVKYNDKAPWPISPDGGSSSLERICPTVKGDEPENWAASPLPKGVARPTGTPGKKNAAFSETLPPVVNVKEAPRTLAPDQAINVEALVKGNVGEVTLLYRLVSKGVEARETSIAMTRDDVSGQYRATIPAQAAGTLVRYRVKAGNDKGATRFQPDANDLRPTFSTYVHDKWPAARIPFGLIVNGMPKVGLAGMFGGGGVLSERQALGMSAYV